MALKKTSIPSKAPDGLETSWKFLYRLFTNFQKRLPRYRWMAGALVEMSSNQSIASGSPTILTWGNTIYDDENLWDGGDPTKLVVPAGFDGRAYLAANVQIVANSTGQRALGVFKNGASYTGRPYLKTKATSGAVGLNVVGSLVDVTEGDYFEVQASQYSGGALNVVASDLTWFHMILYEKSAK